MHPNPRFRDQESQDYDESYFRSLGRRAHAREAQKRRERVAFVCFIIFASIVMLLIRVTGVVS